MVIGPLLALYNLLIKYYHFIRYRESEGNFTLTSHRLYREALVYRIMRKILRVSWKDHVPNQEILRRAKLPGIEAMLNLAQLRWSGHVSRMNANPQGL